MDVIATLVANHVEIAADKLYISGAGWAWLSVEQLPETVILSVAVVIAAEPQEQIDNAAVSVHVVGPNGMLIQSSGVETFLTRPDASAMVVVGQPIVHTLAFTVPFEASTVGRHAAVVFLNGRAASHSTAPFAIVRR